MSAEWLASSSLFDEEQKRETIISKIKEKKAFWMLPDKGELCWFYYAANDKNSNRFLIFRKLGDSIHEIILSDDELLNQEAISDLYTNEHLKDLKANMTLWSAKKPPKNYQLENIYLAMVQPSAREKVDFKKENKLLTAVLIMEKNLSNNTMHSGFPKPMLGFLINKN
jgi:hypothetical protein